MNVNDFTADQIKGDKLIAIFVQQHKLAEKYMPIEGRNDLLQTADLPVNLHDPKGQARLKDFAWRVTEEISEAVDAASVKGWGHIHAREEVADSLHFLVEMALLGGVGPEHIVTSPESIDSLETMFDARLEHHFRPVDGIKPMFGRPEINPAVVKFMTSLGMTCHTLKNKPWKTTQMLTDVPTFQTRMVQVFYNFVDICLAIDMTSDDLVDLYFRKAMVNEFRQRSNY